MARSTVRRLTGAATAGMLAVAVLPALAAPAFAAPVDLDPKAAVAEIDAALAKNRAALAGVGGLQQVTAKYEVGFPVFESDSIAMTVAADPVRGNLRSTIDMGGLGVPDDFDEGPLSGFSDNPCQPERDGYVKNGAATEILRPGVGTYTAFGSSPGKYVKQARKLVKRPKARWELRKGGPRTFADAAARSDVASGFISYLRAAELVSATKDVLADGVRYRVTYAEEAFTGDEPSEGVVSVLVDAAGKVASIEDRLEMAEDFTSTTKVVYSFAPQTVLTPAAAATVDRKRIVKGCRAVLTRVLTDEVAREAKKWSNRMAGPRDDVTAGDIRRQVRSTLRQEGFALNIEDDSIDGGVMLTGKHKLLKKPVVRRVVVVKGKAVVRKGPGAGAKRKP